MGEGEEGKVRAKTQHDDNDGDNSDAIGPDLKHTNSRAMRTAWREAMKLQLGAPH